MTPNVTPNPPQSGPATRRRGYRDQFPATDHAIEVTLRNRAKAKGYTLHALTTPAGRRWLLVSLRTESIRHGELICDLDAVADEITEASTDDREHEQVYR